MARGLHVQDPEVLTAGTVGLARDEIRVAVDDPGYEDLR
jgi:hypothetical protein